jgi:hypothetical protein
VSVSANVVEPGVGTVVLHLRGLAPPRCQPPPPRRAQSRTEGMRRRPPRMDTADPQLVHPWMPSARGRVGAASMGGRGREGGEEGGGGGRGNPRGREAGEAAAAGCEPMSRDRGMEKRNGGAHILEGDLEAL